jgi:hypothetical protein
MDKEEQEDIVSNIDPFLFFAVMLGVLTVKSEYNDEPEEECRPEY